MDFLGVNKTEPFAFLTDHMFKFKLHLENLQLAVPQIACQTVLTRKQTQGCIYSAQKSIRTNKTAYNASGCISFVIHSKTELFAFPTDKSQHLYFLQANLQTKCKTAVMRKLIP